MQLKITINGDTPILMHSTAGLEKTSPAAIEKAAITAKRTNNRTAADDARIKELETLLGFWLNEAEQPTIPPQALRACLEEGAKKYREGPAARGGLVVLSSKFHYDTERYGSSLEELTKSTQSTVFGAVGGRGSSRIPITRPKFDLPWSCEFEVEIDEEEIDMGMLEKWLDKAGRVIGIGAWRPARSGIYGRFNAAVEVKDN